MKKPKDKKEKPAPKKGDCNRPDDKQPERGDDNRQQDPEVPPVIPL